MGIVTIFSLESAYIISHSECKRKSVRGFLKYLVTVQHFCKSGNGPSAVLNDCAFSEN